MEVNTNTLENELSNIIKKIGKEKKIEVFANNPDFLEERLKSWHQFGLLSHTKRVRNIFLNELNNLLELWGLEDIKEYLNAEINGCEKRKLLEIGILVHDLGKIVLVGDKRVHRNHERESESIILKLKELRSLSKEQLDYVLRCVNSHDVIGKEIRDYLVEKNKFNLEFLNSDKIKKILDPIIRKNSDVKIEIGVFYLCDSLGKTNIIIEDYTDEKNIIEILKKRKLPLELKNGIMQLPLNIKLAEVYLKNI